MNRYFPKRDVLGNQWLQVYIMGASEWTSLFDILLSCYPTEAAADGFLQFSKLQKFREIKKLLLEKNYLGRL